MKYLLDTCVLSELAKLEPETSVRDAVMNIPDDALYLSVVTVGEIRKGIALLPKGKRKDSLTEWFDTLERDYNQRIMPIDSETATIWGEITASAQQDGYALHVADGLIAATAIQHGLHVMTRNIKDFEPSRALLVNPWS